MLYKIADVVFSMEPDKMTKTRAEKYEYYGDEKPVFSVLPKSREDYDLLQNKKGRTFEQYQHTSCGNAFQHEMYFHNSISLHSSAVVVDDKAYLFTARSGTGKSTHTSNWLKLFGEKAYILNDDKPTIRIIDGVVYAYGTPWSGKHDLSVNKRVELAGIALLERDDHNHIELLDEFSAFITIYSGVLKKFTEEEAEVVTKTIKTVVEKVPVWKLSCLPDIESAKVAFSAMSENKKR